MVHSLHHASDLLEESVSPSSCPVLATSRRAQNTEHINGESHHKNESSRHHLTPLLDVTLPAHETKFFRYQSISFVSQTGGCGGCPHPSSLLSGFHPPRPRRDILDLSKQLAAPSTSDGKLKQATQVSKSLQSLLRSNLFPIATHCIYAALGRDIFTTMN
jgi:hypothetical protein